MGDLGIQFLERNQLAKIISRIESICKAHVES